MTRRGTWLLVLTLLAVLLLPTAAGAVLVRPGANLAPALADSMRKPTTELLANHPRPVVQNTLRRAKNAPLPTPETRAYLVHNKRGWLVVVVNPLPKGSTHLIEPQFFEEFGEGFPRESLLDLPRFTGKEFDPASGLYYWYARWYDPQTGRFISRDAIGPIVGDLARSPYSYCRNNPFLYTDPSGLWEILSDKGTAIADKRGDSLWRLATKLKREYGITLSENEIIDMMVSANGMKDRDLVLLNEEYDISSIIPRVSGVGNVSSVSTQTISPAHETGDVILSDRDAHVKFEIAGGLSVHGSTVNPLTSGLGGVYGLNVMRFSKTGRRHGYGFTSPEGMNRYGLDVGAAVESVWAVGPVGTGPDQWAGVFQSFVGSNGPFTGSVFWSPGEGGWIGISLGFNYGPPGLAYEETFYNEGNPIVLTVP